MKFRSFYFKLNFWLLIPKTVQSDGTCLQQFRDLKEQYCRLQEDYKNKVREVSCLRTDLEKLRCTLKETEYEKKRQDCSVAILEKKIKTLEADIGDKNSYFLKKNFKFNFILKINFISYFINFVLNKMQVIKRKYLSKSKLSLWQDTDIMKFKMS